MGVGHHRSKDDFQVFAAAHCGAGGPISCGNKSIQAPHLGCSCICGDALGTPNGKDKGQVGQLDHRRHRAGDTNVRDLRI